jgi:hypothetical protein
MQYNELVMLYGNYIEHGSISLDRAILVVDGVIVPEPATFVLLGMGGIFLKKRYCTSLLLSISGMIVV